ncbi:MAG: c-type cytochrome domain-containing protein [Balneolaceae bacterium]|nr:c-type cytochrome domain-containing protein [Balneolaceae bacterium]
MLAYDGNYSESTIFYHRWGGIWRTVVLALRCLHWLLYRAEESKKKRDLNIYRGTLASAVLILTITGHFGANLTHGSRLHHLGIAWNHQTLPDGEFAELVQEVDQHREMGTLAETRKTRLNVGVADAFSHKPAIAVTIPMMAEGGLVLNSEEAVMKGGDDGPIIVPGKPDESELVRRITLPEGHEDVMPQKGSSLSASQIELIRTWVEVGAPWSDQEVKTFVKRDGTL